MKQIAVLDNVIQEYAWGSESFIPELIGSPQKPQSPQAELWMGAHPMASSRVIFDEQELSLAVLIQETPVPILGQAVAEKFSWKLPFLFKVLAAARPLSIQAHPNRLQAEQGFAEENKRGIPIDAPHRDYRDDNHKPELICALRPLTVLKGFRSPKDILARFSSTDRIPKGLDLDILKTDPENRGLKAFFISLMGLEPEERKGIIKEIVRYGETNRDTDPVFYWTDILSREYPDDIGVLSPLFLNLIQLQPGEALFIPAGELHAYLEGAGIELMANSDNVLRGGLTEKHINGPELIKILNFSQGNTEILKADYDSQGEGFYPVMAEEFCLSVISLEKGRPYWSRQERSIEIMICVNGTASVSESDKDNIIEVSKGKSIIIPAAIRQYSIKGEGTIYKASVPV